jgi:hypothetical protein
VFLLGGHCITVVRCWSLVDVIGLYLKPSAEKSFLLLYHIVRVNVKGSGHTCGQFGCGGGQFSPEQVANQ